METGIAVQQEQSMGGLVAAASNREGLAVQTVETDSRLIELWLHGRSLHTQRAYRKDAGRFLSFVGVPLSRVTLGDVQDFADSLSHLAQSSQARTVAAVKSLLSFAHRLGHLPFDVGAPVKAPKVKETLAERILPEEQMQRILALETHPRNSVLLRLLYASGGRVSEVCGLKWKDCQERDEGQGQITLYGKGSKTRAVLLSASTWGQLLTLKGRSGPEDPIFRSRKGKATGGGPLDTSQVLRIVQAAGERAGIAGVTPHWFRHSHATHALDRGAPIHLVQATLGHSSVATTGRYLHARPTDSSSRYLVV